MVDMAIVPLEFFLSSEQHEQSCLLSTDCRAVSTYANPLASPKLVSQHKAGFAGVKDVNIWPVEPALPVRMHEMKQRVVHTIKKCYQLGCRRWRRTNVALWLAHGWSCLEKKLMILQVGSEQSHTDSTGSLSRRICTAMLGPLLVMPGAFKPCSASV